MSPSMSIKRDIDDDMTQGVAASKSFHKLFKYYCTNGLCGPVSAALDKDSFLLGSCDFSTTLSFELQIESETIDDYVSIDDREVKLSPCIQSCFSYTCVLKINGKWSTVRRLRVLTEKLETTNDTESITLSLDSEGLAVVSCNNLFYCVYVQTSDVLLFSKKRQYY